MKREKHVLIVAGEASGDLHGSLLVKALKKYGDLKFSGIGGDYMQGEGVDLIAHVSHLAVVGFTEVFSSLSYILKVRRKIIKFLKEKKPSLVILIDYPEFNIHLAKVAKSLNTKVFYYISPQVWAWRTYRIKKIKKYVDKIAVIFPFEEEFYARYGVTATFVGHPLLDIVRTQSDPKEIIKRLGLEESRKTVALLPGSRESEIKRILPVMMEAARIMESKTNSLQFLLPPASTLSLNIFEEMLKNPGVKIEVIKNTYDVLGVSDVAIVASGTATLETALMEKPMVIVYKVSPLTYLVGRMLVRVDHIGIVNIIAGRTVVPELVQKRATAENIAKETMKILMDEGYRESMIKELSKIKEKLGKPGASERAAALVREIL
ncbi:MAG: lipid-A-disaccharide synthase [Syntrophales bacterium]|nr:lipid-A-disaccharide synthase [Syntrophales bacterium]